MSLINEALKKAQRQRHDQAAPANAGAAGETSAISKRGQPRSAQTTLLIIAGAAVLVAVSIAVTAFWLTRPPSREAEVATSKTAIAAKPGESPAPAVKFNGPTAESRPVAVETQASPAPARAAAIAPPTAQPAAAVALTPPDRTPTRPTAAEAAPVAVTLSPAASPLVTENAAPTAATPAAATPAAPTAAPAAAATAKALPAAAPKQDERILRYIDTVKVAGVRTSGADSKVLMNDRVYRLNEFVDRALGLRLTKVTRESITFTDANGVTYVKNL